MPFSRKCSKRRADKNSSVKVQNRKASCIANVESIHLPDRRYSLRKRTESATSSAEPPHEPKRKRYGVDQDVIKTTDKMQHIKASAKKAHSSKKRKYSPEQRDSIEAKLGQPHPSGCHKSEKDPGNSKRAKSSNGDEVGYSTISPNSTCHKTMFFCDTCGKMYDTKRNILAHLPVHSSERPFSCEICGKRFHRKSDVLKHLPMHSDRMYLCDICGVQYARPGALRRHLRSHTGERQHICDVCGKEYYCREDLKVHFNSFHRGQVFFCDVCGEKLGSKSALRTHSFKHLPPDQRKPFSCYVCGRSFTLKSTLHAHLMTHNPDRKVVSRCTVCDAEFYHRSSLKKHMSLHANTGNQLSGNEGGANKTDVYNADKPYVCKLCTREFVSEARAGRHVCITSVNSSSRKSTVGVNREDGKKLTTVESSESSAAGNNQNDDRDEGCDNADQPDSHRDLVHTSTGGLLVSCDNIPETSTDLKMHLDSYHRGKSFVCDVCGAKLGTKSALRIHSFKHLPLHVDVRKPFSCSVCGQSFAVKSALHSHLLTHNPDRRVVSRCTVCDVEFYQRSSLKKHMSLHANTGHQQCGNEEGANKTDVSNALCVTSVNSTVGVNKEVGEELTTVESSESSAAGNNKNDNGDEDCDCADQSDSHTDLVQTFTEDLLVSCDNIRETPTDEGLRTKNLTSNNRSCLKQITCKQDGMSANSYAKNDTCISDLCKKGTPNNGNTCNASVDSIVPVCETTENESTTPVLASSLSDEI